MAASLLSTGDLTRHEIECLLARADEYARGAGARHPDAVILLAFFEESVRTRVGFEVAAARLGSRTTTLFAGKATVSMSAPETFDDALRSVGAWCDAVCLRHPDPRAPALAAEVVARPIVNCGNGQADHPSQALIDLFAIERQLGRLDGLRVALVGDLTAMRAAHGLGQALTHFAPSLIRCIAPRRRFLPERVRTPLLRAAGRFEETDVLDIDDVDLVYVAGLPHHIDADTTLTEAEHAAFRITSEHAAALAPGARVLCPLPRIDEIERAVDALPQAGYFAQSESAVAVRMAVLDRALDGTSA